MFVSTIIGIPNLSLTFETQVENGFINLLIRIFNDLRKVKNDFIPI